MNNKKKMYKKAMRKASVVEGPKDVLGKVKNRGKVLGKFNDYIY